MGVRIKEINVQNLGPLTRFNMKLGLFNLIYGRNEQGKTYLVEFLIRSLFKNVRDWGLRSEAGRGSIVVEGLGTEKVHFSLSPSPKIDDFWEKEDMGLPTDYSRLIVVKGAEVELTSKEAPSDRAILKRYLSGQELLDIIEKRISPTIQSCQLENGTIIGPNRGEKKSKDDHAKKLTDVDQLFEQLDKGYSNGKRKILSDNKNNLEVKLDLIEKAKCYLAYKLSQEIDGLKNEKRRFSEEVLRSASENHHSYRLKIKEMKRKENSQKESENNSRHYKWLKKAEQNYKDLLHQEGLNFSHIFLILSLIFILITVVFIIIKISIGTYVTLACAVLFGFLYYFRIRTFIKTTPGREELEKLNGEFKSRFDRDLTDLTTIQEMIQKEEEFYNKSKLLNEQLADDIREMESIQIKISQQIFELTGERIDPEKWDQTLRGIELRLKDLDSKIHEKEKRLARLNVSASDYLIDKPEMNYDEQLYEKIQTELDHFKSKINEENDKLNILRNRICDQTRDDFDTEWETLIQHLRQKRIDLIAENRKITAEIIGKKVVHHVLTDLRKDEDSKIIQGLKSEMILDPLQRITQRYKGLELQDDKLIVYDDYDHFDLADLSTGAQEQIFLALRIGFVQKLVKSREPLFLILDDAFQYSDWERRVWLMDMMVDLAKAGWQILYFTMDDHIRGLFEKKGKIFGGQFRIIELATKD